MEYLISVYPLGSIRFFKKIYLFGLLTGVGMYIPICYYLHEHWSSTLLCERILRAYHLIRVTLFVLQLPLKFVMYRQLSRAKELERREEVVECLLSLLKSPYWQINQTTGKISYLMFSFAFVFSLTGSHCSNSSPMLFRFLLVNLLVFLVHLICSCVWLRQVTVEDAFDAAMWKRGIDTKQIEKYTKLIIMPQTSEKTATNDSAEASDSSSPSIDSILDSKPIQPRVLIIDGFKLDTFECSICFCEYKSGDAIRVLPCAHHHHAACVDEWVQRCRSCPNCQHLIDKPIVASNYTKEHQIGGAGNHDLIVGAALTGEPNVPTENVSSSSTSTTSSDESKSSFSSSHIASSSSSSAASTSSSSASSSSTTAFTSPLMMSLRSRRIDGQIAAKTSSSSNDVDEFREPATEPVASSESSVLTHRGVPIERKQVESTDSASIVSSTVASPPSSSSSSSSSIPAASSRTAAPLSPSRAPYAAARLAATQAWRTELDQWADQFEDEDQQANQNSKTELTKEQRDKQEEIDRLMAQLLIEEKQQHQMQRGGELDEEDEFEF